MSHIKALLFIYLLLHSLSFHFFPAVVAKMLRRLAHYSGSKFFLRQITGCTVLVQFRLLSRPPLVIFLVSFILTLNDRYEQAVSLHIERKGERERGEKERNSSRISLHLKNSNLIIILSNFFIKLFYPRKKFLCIYIRYI